MLSSCSLPSPPSPPPGPDVALHTSLLNTSTGTPSAAEQAALQAWINAGGTLIVAGDIFPPLNRNTNNTRLANNIAQWACHGVVAVEPATWGQVKSVFAR